MYKELQEVWAQQMAPGSLFEVARANVGGHLVKMWANAPDSLRDVWRNTAVFGSRDYLVYQDERWSYDQAHEQVNRIAAWLSASGVSPGDKVAIALRNYPEWMLAHWAIVSIGAVVVGMNAWWTSEEMKYALADSDADMLLADSERLARFANIQRDFPNLPVVAVRVKEALPDWATPWSEMLRAEPELADVVIDPDDDACIFYTSGTTGTPKGAQLSHRGCTNNLMTLAFGTLATKLAEEKLEAGSDAEPEEEPVASTIVATPLFHVTANNCIAQFVTMGGGKLVLMYKWDPGEALRIIEAEKITVFSGVPVMMREVVSHPDFSRRDTSSMATLSGGGAPVHPDLIDKIEKTDTPLRASQGYGMTETCGMISMGSGVYLADKPRSAGLVMPIFDLKCIDEAGNTLPQGQRGEICVRGAQLIKGYLNRPEATAETIIDGWLHTGDIGYLDEENCIFLLDRSKDMVLRGGENVYCSEVEAAIHNHQSVLECAVFSVPDERLGEEVGAAILLEKGVGLTADEIREFCKTGLAAYKIPRYIWLTDKPLPKNASGKYLKRELMESLDLADAD